MKYKLIIDNPTNAHILDIKKNKIVALCSTKRPDSGFSKLEELVKLANESERYKLEMEQHRKQNPVFYDGGRNEDVYVLQEENLKLKQWINDLQSGMYVNCVYCGHRYGPEGETPVSMAEVLKEHIENCPNHPVSELKQQIKELTRIIARNLVAWDNSKDKKESLLPEVYVSNKYFYEQLTGVKYNLSDAIKRFNIGY